MPLTLNQQYSRQPLFNCGRGDDTHASGTIIGNRMRMRLLCGPQCGVTCVSPRSPLKKMV